ncbi:MAG: phosphatidate cytidylyltransferase [Actinomycetota bacterium]
MSGVTWILQNPLDHVLFLPTVIRVAILLATGALTVILAERKPLRQLRQTVLFKRVFSWSVMAPTFLAAIFVGGPVGLLVILYLILQGTGEYARLVGIARPYAWLLLIAGLLTPVLTGLLSEYFLFAPLLFFVLVTSVPIFTGKVIGSHIQVTSTLFGYLYIPFFLSYLIFIKLLEPDGLEILLMVGLGVALSDIVAFSLGKAFGGHKLASAVSPNKTWAGAGGNLLGAYAAWVIMWFAIPGEWSLATRLVGPAITAAAAVWGDLVESSVKRDFGVKDAGDLLPGFGGLLDRIDSLLVALPITYYAIVITQHFSVGPRT